MFHSQNGLFFDRSDEDGSVLIRWQADGGKAGAPILAETTLTASGWASVVASVCKRNESGETYRDALAFHEAAPSKPPVTGQGEET